MFTPPPQPPSPPAAPLLLSPVGTAPAITIVKGITKAEKMRQLVHQCREETSRRYQASTGTAQALDFSDPDVIILYKQVIGEEIQKQRDRLFTSETIKFAGKPAWATGGLFAAEQKTRHEQAVRETKVIAAGTLVEDLATSEDPELREWSVKSKAVQQTISDVQECIVALGWEIEKADAEALMKRGIRQYDNQLGVRSQEKLQWKEQADQARETLEQHLKATRKLSEQTASQRRELEQYRLTLENILVDLKGVSTTAAHMVERQYRIQMQHLISEIASNEALIQTKINEMPGLLAAVHETSLKAALAAGAYENFEKFKQSSKTKGAAIVAQATATQKKPQRSKAYLSEESQKIADGGEKSEHYYQFGLKTSKKTELTVYTPTEMLVLAAALDEEHRKLIPLEMKKNMLVIGIVESEKQLSELERRCSDQQAELEIIENADFLPIKMPMEPGKVYFKPVANPSGSGNGLTCSFLNKNGEKVTKEFAIDAGNPCDQLSLAGQKQNIIDAVRQEHTLVDLKRDEQKATLHALNAALEQAQGDLTSLQSLTSVAGISIEPIPREVEQKLSVALILTGAPEAIPRQLDSLFKAALGPVNGGGRIVPAVFQGDPKGFVERALGISDWGRMVDSRTPKELEEFWKLKVVRAQPTVSASASPSASDPNPVPPSGPSTFQIARDAVSVSGDEHQAKVEALERAHQRAAVEALEAKRLAAELEAKNHDLTAALVKAEAARLQAQGGGAASGPGRPSSPPVTAEERAQAAVASQTARARKNR